MKNSLVKMNSKKISNHIKLNVTALIEGIITKCKMNFNSPFERFVKSNKNLLSSTLNSFFSRSGIRSFQQIYQK